MIKSQTIAPRGSVSRAAFTTGVVIRVMCILFLLFDSIAKVVRDVHAVRGTTELGWPDHSVRFLGILLLTCTVLYAIPRTAVLGAILLTGYLGGAIATMVRMGQPLYFASVFGVMVWLSIYLTHYPLRNILPLLNKHLNSAE